VLDNEFSPLNKASEQSLAFPYVLLRASFLLVVGTMAYMTLCIEPVVAYGAIMEVSAKPWFIAVTFFLTFGMVQW
jgi:hypothetical protein